MKTVSTAVTVLLIVLVALTLVPAAADFRPEFSVAALVAALALLVTAVTGGKERAEAPAARVESAARPAQVKAAPAAVSSNRAEAEVLTFLAGLQERGRLVDFLMEDIALYSDGQICAAARVVHQGCKAVLLDCCRIVPVLQEEEGARVTVPAGYRADEYRLVGKISGQAPFTGTLMHRGWKAESVKLPRAVAGDDRLPTIAPAEVEL